MQIVGPVFRTRNLSVIRYKSIRQESIHLQYLRQSQVEQEIALVRCTSQIDIVLLGSDPDQYKLFTLDRTEVESLCTPDVLRNFPNYDKDDPIRLVGLAALPLNSPSIFGEVRRRMVGNDNCIYTNLICQDHLCVNNIDAS